MQQKLLLSSNAIVIQSYSKSKFNYYLENKMKKLVALTTVVLVATAFFMLNNTESKTMSNGKTVHDFEVETIDGKKKNLSEYKGKVLLIVNTASECGFTPQYEGLQDIYEKYNEKGFEVLGFPCNQFGGQEPGTNDEIQQFCTTKFSVKFPMFAKIDVNGDNAHPLYKYLKSEQSGLITDDIKWNFTKFLIDKNGNPVDRYAPQTKPKSISEDIEKHLAK